MNVVARQTIRTGHPISDDQMLEQMRAHAAAQGCELVVQRIPDGGYQVDVVRAAYGAPPPAPAYGAPPPQQLQQQPPQQVMQQAMQPYAQPQMPQPNMAASPFRGPPASQAQRPLAVPGVCQACGRNAPTQQVTFRQNIGAIVLRFPKSISGQLCRRCIGTYFWKYTTTSFFLGWWGIISFFYTFVTIPINIVTYLGALSLPKEFPRAPQAPPQYPQA